MKYYVDCEFDGHNGPLLSIAAVREDGLSVYVQTHNIARDPWVVENVAPLMEAGPFSTMIPEAHVGHELRQLLDGDDDPVIVADSPVDVQRFFQAFMTNDEGGYHANFKPVIRAEVYDVESYPTNLEGAVQHNAWWDAMALREKLSK